MAPARGPACEGPNYASGRLPICQRTPDGSRPTFGDEAPKAPEGLSRQCISILVDEDVWVGYGAPHVPCAKLMPGWTCVARDGMIRIHPPATRWKSGSGGGTPS